MSNSRGYKKLVRVVFLLSGCIIAQTFLFDTSSSKPDGEVDERAILDEYGELFLTHQQAEDFIRKAIRELTGNERAAKCLSNVSRGATPWERCDRVVTIHDPCCDSTLRFQALKQAPSFLTGNILTLIQVQNRSQLFSYEECSDTNPTCSSLCKCRNVSSSATALAKTGPSSSKVVMRRIRYNGCCHCLSGFP